MAHVEPQTDGHCAPYYIMPSFRIPLDETPDPSKAWAEHNDNARIMSEAIFLYKTTGMSPSLLVADVVELLALIEMLEKEEYTRMIMYGWKGYAVETPKQFVYNKRKQLMASMGRST